MNITIEEELSNYSHLLSNQALFLSQMRKKGEVQRLRLLWEMLREERRQKEDDLQRLQAQLSEALSSINQYERVALKYRERSARAERKAQRNKNEEKHPSQKKNILKAEQKKEQSLSIPTALSKQELLPAQEKEKLYRGPKGGKQAHLPAKGRQQDYSSTEPKEEKGEDIEYAQSLFSRARQQQDEHKYGMALQLYQQCLLIRERINGIETADVLHQIGWMYYYQRDYLKALEYYGLALGIYEKVKGKGCFESADTLNNMGLVYDDQRDYAKALECYKEAQSIYEKFGIKNREYGNTLFNMGSTYSVLKDFEAAAEAYQSSLKVYERLHLQEKVERGALELAKCLKILKRDQELQLITSKYELENKI